jgi:hypothetical protein
MVVGIAHLARVVFQWPVLMNGWDVPMWVSVGGVVVPLALSVYGFIQWRRL